MTEPRPPTHSVRALHPQPVMSGYTSSSEFILCQGVNGSIIQRDFRSKPHDNKQACTFVLDLTLCRRAISNGGQHPVYNTASLQKYALGKVTSTQIPRRSMSQIAAACRLPRADSHVLLFSLNCCLELGDPGVFTLKFQGGPELLRWHFVLESGQRSKVHLPARTRDPSGQQSRVD